MPDTLSLTGLLQIAIIIAGIYAGLSWLLSALHERIADVLKLRGNKLYQGVLNLLCGHSALVSEIFNHPMITSASDRRGMGKWNPLALLSLAPRADAGRASEGAPGRDAAARPYRPSYVEARNFSLAFWQSLSSLTATGAPETQDSQAGQALAALVKAPQALIRDLRTSVGGLEGPYPALYKAVTALLSQADGDYEKLLAATDAWFNAQMDRVSGWYTRQTQFIVACMALILVGLTGIDSIEIVKGLYVRPDLRSSLEHQITSTIKQCSPTPAPAASGAAQASRSPKPSATPVPSELCDDLSILELQGWIHWLSPGRHWAGMCVTFIALSIGGPFWFDLLKSLVNVRAAGPKPDHDANARKKT